MSIKGSEKEAKVEEFMYRDKTNVERELYGATVHPVNGPRRPRQGVDV
jgi:hypothetical protein